MTPRKKRGEGRESARGRGVCSPPAAESVFFTLSVCIWQREREKERVYTCEQFLNRSN